MEVLLIVLCVDVDKLLLEDVNVVVDGLMTGVLLLEQSWFDIRLFNRVIRTVLMIVMIRAATAMHIETIARTNAAIVMPVCGDGGAAISASPLNKSIVYYTI